MNFDTGEFYEKFLIRICFRSDLTSLTATLHICVYAYACTSISISIENPEQLYAELMLLYCKRTVHRSVS